MTIWTLAALLIGAMTVASMLPARTPPPTYIVMSAAEPPAGAGSGAGAVALPLLLLVGAIVAAALLL